jgi:hypothetical protein
MRTILYIGDVITAGNLQRESKKYKVEILPFHAAESTSKEITDVIYDDSNRYFGVIINIDELTISVNETQNIVKDMLVKTDMMLCLLCAGHKIEEPVIRNLVEIGVQFFMTGVNSIINAKVILNMLKGQPNVASLFPNNEGVSNGSDNKIKTKSITVGGCLPRMGVTTFCIQLIQFLHSIGKKACYVDRTSSNYMDDFILIYEKEGVLDQEHSRFTLEGIDFYYAISDEAREFAKKQGYDYIVADVGTLNFDEKLLELFTGSDMHILCAGSKPNEFKAVYNLLEVLIDKGVRYVFYSVPRAQRKSIAGTCENHNQKCYFMPFLDDEFILQKNSRGMFYKMFSIERSVDE